MTKHGIDQHFIKGIAKDIFYQYDRDRTNVLDIGKASSMLHEATHNLSNISHSKQDVAFFMKYLDHNKDGRVTVDDFESVAIKYLHPQKYSNIHVVNKPISPPKPVLDRKYTNTVRKRLDVARRLFQKYDKDFSNSLTEDEIPLIIRQTYRDMGISYQPTKQDISIWMTMTDTNKDGIVQLHQFEAMIIRSLQRIGIQIYE